MRVVQRFAQAAVHVARLSVYGLGMVTVCAYAEIVGRIWCIWLAPEGSRARVQRANRLTRQWNTLLTQLTLSVFGARLDVEGNVPDGRFIVVSNHQSIADIAILSSVLRNLNLKFVAKDDLARGVPAVSLALQNWGSALISRKATRHDARRLRSMAKDLARWEGSVVIFPEGTRSRDGRVLPYRAAAVRIVAEEARLPILPVVIDGTHSVSDLLGFAGHMSGAHGTLKIGNPIPPEQWQGRIEEVVSQIHAWAGETVAAGRDHGEGSRAAGHCETVAAEAAAGFSIHPTG